MDVSAIHVNGEARAYARDPVEERAPGRNIEELRDELAPVGEPGPVQIGDRDAVAREPRDFGEGLIRAGEVRGVDDEAVGERHEIVEMLRFPGRRSRPPEEHRQVGHEQRDDDARHAFVEVAAHAGEDLLVEDRLRAVGPRDVTVELHRSDEAVAIPIAEQDDGARGMAKRQIRDCSRGTARMHFTLGVHDEVEHRSTRQRLATLPGVGDRGAAQPRELVFERIDGRRPRAPEHLVDHGRRQLRPSRAMSASACSGPHAPAA